MSLDASSVATAFTVGAVVVGIASIAMLLLAAALYLPLMRKSPPVRPLPTPNPDAVLLTLQGMTRVTAFFGGALGALGKVAAIALALVGFAGLAFAVLLWVTGDGLRAGAGWARETASVVAVFVTIASAGLFLGLRGLRRLPPLALASAAVYGLIVLWRG